MPFLNSLSTIPYGKEILFKLEGEEYIIPNILSEIEVINKALERDLLVAVIRGIDTDIW